MHKSALLIRVIRRATGTRAPGQQAGRGLRQILEAIYTQHRQGLFTLALSITRHAERAEDAVQEAFARLCRTVIEPSGDVTAYVFATVRNAALDQVRRNGAAKLTIFANGALNTGEAEPPDRALIAHERNQGVQEAVEALPDAQRQVIVMKLYGELTFDQIATVLGEPLPTVASRYRRALERLKASVESLV